MTQHTNFSNLYRAAYAETDHERKLIPLSEVRRAIDNWKKEQRENKFHLLKDRPDAKARASRDQPLGHIA